MRTINELIIHCSATAEGKDFTAADIDRWHRVQGWSGIGYHFVIRLDGTVEPGRPIDKAGAHCSGHNANSLGICYIGGIAPDGKTPKDTRTPAQRLSLRILHHPSPHLPWYCPSRPSRIRSQGMPLL
ncbi:MAG: N-acetylmuramoyl-L-alanine amidase [Prevotellaceae bacterium]|nr:N-acetylmuramoyl-L-alanine amidase [Candidatus Minthosoma equi]